KHENGREIWTSDDPVPYRKQHLFCDRCNHLEELDGTTVTAAAGLCPDCGNALRVQQVVAPAGFRSDGREYDAPEGDSTGRGGRAFVAALTNPQQGASDRTCRNTSLSLTSQGRVFRVNDNSGRGHRFNVVQDSPSRPLERKIAWEYIEG